jgi:hypothetical protein
MQTVMCITSRLVNIQTLHAAYGMQMLLADPRIAAAAAEAQEWTVSAGCTAAACVIGVGQGRQRIAG